MGEAAIAHQAMHVPVGRGQLGAERGAEGARLRTVRFGVDGSRLFASAMRQIFSRSGATEGLIWLGGADWRYGNSTLGVTSNESPNALGDGNTAADWQILDAHRLLLRAERSGRGLPIPFDERAGCACHGSRVVAGTHGVRTGVGGKRRERWQQERGM